MVAKVVKIALVCMLCIVANLSFDYDGHYSPMALLILPPLVSLIFILSSNVYSGTQRYKISYYAYSVFLFISAALMSAAILSQKSITVMNVHYIYYLYAICLFYVFTILNENALVLVPVVTFFWSLYNTVTFVQYPHFELSYWTMIFIVHVVYIVVCGYIYMVNFKLYEAGK